MSDDRKQIHGIIAVLRGHLNHVLLLKSIPDDKLLRNAAQLLEQIKSGDSEPVQNDCLGGSRPGPGKRELTVSF